MNGGFGKGSLAEATRGVGAGAGTASTAGMRTLIFAWQFVQLS